MKVLVLDGVAAAGVKVLTDAGLEVDIKGTPGKDELLAMAGNYEAMIVRSQTTVTADVPAGALAISRCEQKNIEGWVERRKEKRARHYNFVPYS